MDKRLRRIYLNYNRRYFKGELPTDAEIVWEPLAGSLLGYQCGDKIALNAKMKHADVIWRGTLLHEMVHLELPAKVKHGPRFRKRMRELVAQGAFDGLI
jgi:hypothetical protein